MFYGPSWSYGSWIYYYLCNQCLSPLTLWVRILLINKTGHHDITEILLKVALNTITPPIMLTAGRREMRYMFVVFIDLYILVPPPKFKKKLRSKQKLMCFPYNSTNPNFLCLPSSFIAIFGQTSLVRFFSYIIYEN